MDCGAHDMCKLSAQPLNFFILFLFLLYLFVFLIKHVFGSNLLRTVKNPKPIDL